MYFTFVLFFLISPIACDTLLEAISSKLELCNRTFWVACDPNSGDYASYPIPFSISWDLSHKDSQYGSKIESRNRPANYIILSLKEFQRFLPVSMTKDEEVKAILNSNPNNEFTLFTVSIVGPRDYIGLATIFNYDNIMFVDGPNENATSPYTKNISMKMFEPAGVSYQKRESQTKYVSQDNWMKFDIERGGYTPNSCIFDGEISTFWTVAFYNDTGNRLGLNGQYSSNRRNFINYWIVLNKPNLHKLLLTSTEEMVKYRGLEKPIAKIFNGLSSEVKSALLLPSQDTYLSIFNQFDSFCTKRGFTRPTISISGTSAKIQIFFAIHCKNDCSPFHVSLENIPGAYSFFYEFNGRGRLIATIVKTVASPTDLASLFSKIQSGISSQELSD